MAIDNHLFSHMPVDTPINIYGYSPSKLKEGIPDETGGAIQTEPVYNVNLIPTDKGESNVSG